MVVLITGIVLAYFLIRLWIKLVNVTFKLFEEKPKYDSENPYIQAHIMRRVNDSSYDEYMDWLDKTGGDLPIDKFKTPEELRFEKEIGIPMSKR